jgi:hydroxyacylglutathione hydrolase
MLEITPIPAFNDNYIWLLHDQSHAVVVDPGTAQPVIEVLKRQQLHLDAILITHHHHDHIDGVEELVNYANCPVYAPRYEQYRFHHTAVGEGELLQIKALDLHLKVMWLPGHTLGHIAYLNETVLFCGDTLFGAGCGRLFEGTPSQMFASLNRLKQLPKQTQVYCTHEYTAKNIEFALSLEPNNVELQARKADVSALRNANIPSLPSTIALELETNPFLRCQAPEIMQLSGAKSTDELAVFTAIRERRNHY